MPASFQHAAQLAGPHAINGMLEGIAITVFASVFLWAISSWNSGTRFAVWFSTLLAVAGLSLTASIPAGTTVAAGKTPHFTLPASWAEYALVAWAVIASLGLLRIAIGLAQLWRLRRNCQELPESVLTSEVHQVLEEFRPVRNTKLCVSDTLRVPAATGFFKPAVILPRWAVEDLSPAELKAVLLHELGHLRRRDDWTNLAQKVLRAVLFFHPGVWWIDSRLNLEREMACDDLVLARTGNAHGYAECLVSVAEKSAVRSALALALAAVGRLRHTVLRLTRILDRNRAVDTHMSKAAISAVAAVSVFAFAILPYTPELVAFQSSPIAANSTQSGVSQTVSKAEWKGATPVRYSGEHLTPHLVQAAIHYGSAATDRGFKVKAQHRKRLIRQTLNPATPPMVTRASFAREDSGYAPAVLLIVQTVNYDSADSAMWTICVWRITTVSKGPVTAPDQPQNGTVSKTI